MSLTGVAKETLEIVARGMYVAPSGETIHLRRTIDAAVGGTVLHRPAELEELVSTKPARGDAVRTKIEVTDETTGAAARRKAASGKVVALNYASAKNPGGGFLGGAKAQEEDLARCSALYTCQLTQREYYDANRAAKTLLYTDHLIYSPDVPFFRDERLDLLERPFLASIITSPAPNAGQALRREKNARPKIRAALDQRAAMVLAAAEAHGHRVLVLGAWGCGVFRNDPVEVSEIFADHLASARFAGAFDEIVFAIPGKKRLENLVAFQERFPSK